MYVRQLKFGMRPGWRPIKKRELRIELILMWPWLFLTWISGLVYLKTFLIVNAFLPFLLNLLLIRKRRKREPTTHLSEKADQKSFQNAALSFGGSHDFLFWSIVKLNPNMVNATVPVVVSLLSAVSGRWNVSACKSGFTYTLLNCLRGNGSERVRWLIKKSASKLHLIAVIVHPRFAYITFLKVGHFFFYNWNQYDSPDLRSIYSSSYGLMEIQSRLIGWDIPLAFSHLMLQRKNEGSL